MRALARDDVQVASRSENRRWSRMPLVEQHRIDRHDPRFAAFDAAAFASKHLYNAALSLTRQAFIHQRQVIAYEELARDMKPAEAYRALPAKVAQWVLRQVTLAWTSYFAACAAWQADSSRFLDHPMLPKYLDKRGRNLLTYTEQAINRAPKNRGYVVPSGLDIRVKTRQIVAYLHVASRRIVYWLVGERIGTLIIGKNDGWKQAIRMGKRTNQNVVFVPQARFIGMLTNKAELVGIRVLVTEESYTSQASFLDEDPLPVTILPIRPRSSVGGASSAGCIASDGRRLNADTTDAYNILRKGVPDAFGNRIAGVVVHPVRIALANVPHGSNVHVA
jgi:IS605 OrfB family transposase